MSARIFDRKPISGKMQIHEVLNESEDYWRYGCFFFTSHNLEETAHVPVFIVHIAA